MAKLILYQTKSPYEGDITKNCEMTGTEMDSNFLNLKGDDIKNIVLDDETHILTITRNKDGHKDCNGEIIKARFEIDLKKLDFLDDVKLEDENLVFTKSDGEIIKIKIGDACKIRMYCSTDGTIDGDGSIEHPLSISRASRTGQYSPCLKVVDVKGGEKLPEKPSFGERYVTRETVSHYGKLYPYDAVWKIQKDLETANYAWRVPTKEDWDSTLMLLEGCKELPRGYKSHFSHETGNLGRFAGKVAKTVETWDEPELNEDNLAVMNIYATGFRDAAGNWTAGNDSHGVGKSAAYWSSTLREGEKIDTDGYRVYTKRFDAYKTVNGEKVECNTVRQDVMPQISRLSLKLVKDYDGTNFSSFEDIFGTYYPCELIDARTDDPELNDELNALFKPKIWISANLAYSTEKIENEIEDSPLVNSESSTVGFFINDWDGTRWVRQEMVYGDSVVLTEEFVDESGTTQAREYRVLKDEDGLHILVDLDSRTDDANEKIEYIIESVGLNDDGTIEPFESDIISTATTIIDAVEIISDTLGDEISRVDNITDSVGLTEDGEYIPTTGITSAATSVMEAIEILEETAGESAGNLKAVIEAVGLDEDGHYIDKTGTNYLDDATSVEGEIDALDKALKENTDTLQELAENIIESVGLKEDGTYEKTSGKYTNPADSVKEALELLDAQAESNQGETDRIEEGVGLDENGRYIRKSDSNYLNPATSVEEEIGILDEKLHDKDVELTNVKESVGLNVADGKIPDDAWVGTNVIGENPGSVISAIKIIDKKIGKPTDTRDDFPAGATDEEISLYAFINESDFGEF